MSGRRSVATVLVAAVLPLAMLAPVPAAAELCSVDQAPAATVLLPYFEVDLGGPSGITTLFELANALPRPVLARVRCGPISRSRPTKQCFNPCMFFHQAACAVRPTGGVLEVASKICVQPPRPSCDVIPPPVCFPIAADVEPTFTVPALVPPQGLCSGA